MIRKVLFVDDDRIMQIVVGKQLSVYSEQFSVVMASDGFDAVKKLKEHSFSLAVFDLVMPRMDGMSLVAHTKANYPELPIIVVSSLPREDMQGIVESQGLLSFFSKPFDGEQLGRVIKTALQKEANGGTMHDVSPTVFLQLLEMESKTCTIRVIDKLSHEGGLLWFINGQLVDAKIGELRGIEAAHKVFSWDLITVFMGKECAAREDIINSDLQTIIMTAVGLKDESEDELEDSFSPDDYRDLLEKTIGPDCGLEDIGQDAEIGSVNAMLAKIGTAAEFGNFKLGYITGAQDSDKVILAKKPKTVLSLSQSCQQEKIIKTLLDS